MATAAGIGAREKVFIGGEWVLPAGAVAGAVVIGWTSGTRARM